MDWADAFRILITGGYGAVLLNSFLMLRKKAVRHPLRRFMLKSVGVNSGVWVAVMGHQLVAFWGPGGPNASLAHALATNMVKAAHFPTILTLAGVQYTIAKLEQECGDRALMEEALWRHLQDCGDS